MNAQQTMRSSLAIAGAVAAAFTAVPAAHANVSSNINMPSLTESPKQAGSWNTSTGNNFTISFKWVSDPNHTTVIGWSYPGSGAPSQTAAIGAHNTNYFALPPSTNSSASQPFDLWARVAIGAGSMSARTGGINR